MIIQTLIKHGLGNTARTGIVKQAVHVTGRVVGLASGALFGYSYGQTYGWGTAATYAAASMWGPTAVALTLMSGAKDLGDWASEVQEQKRRSSFQRNRIDDRFGTINRMKQTSIQQLSRDHSSRQRTLGNEGLIFHR